MKARSSRPPGSGSRYRQQSEQAQHLYRALNRTRFGGLLPECEVHLSARLTSCGGICYPMRRRIHLSIHLLRQHDWPEVAEVLLHEMVHLWLHVHAPARGQRSRRPHGREFQAALAAVGGGRRHCLPFSSGRTARVQVYRCPQGHEFVRHRRLSPRMVCAACSRARRPAALAWVEQRTVTR